MKKILYPIVIVAFLIANIATAQPVSLGKFEGAVRDYAYRSIDDPPVPGCMLMVGSSSFRIWGNKAEQLFSKYDTVNRGFGGSQISDNIAAIERIHLPYRPSRIVHFCGGNDFNSGKNVDTVFGDLKYYIARHWNENPFLEFFFVSITQAPSRKKDWPKNDELAERVKELASKTPGLFFIDIAGPMQDEDGRVRENLYIKDRLHLNEEGYAIWARVFREAFDKQDENETKQDVRELFRIRKELGLFDDPRFKSDGVTIKEPPSKDVKLNIVFIGDSITVGGDDKSPPSRCAVYLRKQAGIGDVTISNQGVSGFTTVDFLPSKNKRFPKVVEAADAFKSDKDDGNPGRLVFSIMLGTNDSAVTGPNGAPVSPEDYRKNIREITDKLLADYPGSMIVLHRPIWYSENTKNSSTYLLEGQLRVRSYGLELESLADFYDKTPDAHRVFLGDMKAFHYFKMHYENTMHHEDRGHGVFFLHPNDRGADVLGRFWGAAIGDTLR